jgi:hypothetical protein
MKEFVETLIGRLEECKKIEKCNLYSGIEEGFGYGHCSDAFEDGQTLGAFNAYSSMLDFIKELAEEFDGEELQKSQKIYNYIKQEINPYGKPFDGTVYEFGLKAMKYIENLHTGEYKEGWIPCSQRLPNCEKEFLVTLRDGDVKVARYEKEENIWVDIIEGYFEYPVVAWCELPEPYKKGSETDE